jgi:hypothetical protein
VLIETLEKVPEGAEAPRKDGITPEEVEKEKTGKDAPFPGFLTGLMPRHDHQPKA